MSDRPAVAYCYDGTLDGLFTCLWESYRKKEIPAEIFPPEETQTCLLPCREIFTDLDAADRVQSSIPKKIGPEALHFVRKGFLTCLLRKEWHILMFLRFGFHYGPSVMTMLSHPALAPLFQAVAFLENESQLTREFLRFSEHNGALIARIEPKNQVLPLIAQHFCERFPEERFLIFDQAHHMALAYQPYRYEILPLEHLTVPRASQEELFYRSLWKLFYQAIENKSRHNPKCRMSHMPKRYWRHMTEFEDLCPQFQSSGEGAENTLDVPESRASALLSES